VPEEAKKRCEAEGGGQSYARRCPELRALAAGAACGGGRSCMGRRPDLRGAAARAARAGGRSYVERRSKPGHRRKYLGKRIDMDENNREKGEDYFLPVVVYLHDYVMSLTLQ
jgi:hypothetical protein